MVELWCMSEKKISPHLESEVITRNTNGTASTVDTALLIHHCDYRGHQGYV
jgi:hypothetical protein